jgi:hypothetical protein
MFNKGFLAGSFCEHLQEYVGSTVTIFTTCGGQSGCGFTGVLLFVNPCFVRLVTRIGPAPGCPLGNACNRNVLGGNGGFGGGYNGYGGGYNGFGGNRRCGGYGGGNGIVNTVGSVVDIPIDYIAAFVHNAV